MSEHFTDDDVTRYWTYEEHVAAACTLKDAQAEGKNQLEQAEAVLSAVAESIWQRGYEQGFRDRERTWQETLRKVANRAHEDGRRDAIREASKDMTLLDECFGVQGRGSPCQATLQGEFPMHYPPCPGFYQHEVLRRLAARADAMTPPPSDATKRLATYGMLGASLPQQEDQ
jgi:hypothetical protein